MRIHNKLKKNKKFNHTNIFNVLYKESIKAANCREVPISSLIYNPQTEKIVSKAHNSNKKNFNPCDHAEIKAILKACKKLRVSRLDGYDIFCTLEPCLMCSAVIFQSKIRRIYFALEDKKTGALINNYKLAFDPKVLNKTKIYYGFDEERFSLVLKNFFKQKR